MVETATFSLPQVKGGKMRALAVSTAGRYSPLPDVPTVADTVPGVDFGSWLGLATSPGTPRPIIDRINASVRKVLADPTVRKQLDGQGAEPVGNSPDEYGRYNRAEIERWAAVARQANVPME